MYTFIHHQTSSCPQRPGAASIVSLALLTLAVLFTPAQRSTAQTGDPLGVGTVLSGPNHVLGQDQYLEDLVAPIALYPDDLLAITLPASTFPLQIREAANYLDDLEYDPNLTPDPYWDDSIIALLNYPDVIRLLASDIDWTRRLGEAVQRRQTAVMAAAQRVRARAYAAGNLVSDSRQSVVRSGTTIVIRPANPMLIYVPWYEPSSIFIRHSRPVLSFYPRPYPVYYYPYPVGYGFTTNFFWGLSSYFSIGWSNFSLGLMFHDQIGHPYRNRSYSYTSYRQPHRYPVQQRTVTVNIWDRRDRRDHDRRNDQDRDRDGWNRNYGERNNDYRDGRDRTPDYRDSRNRDDRDDDRRNRGYGDRDFNRSQPQPFREQASPNQSERRPTRIETRRLRDPERARDRNETNTSTVPRATIPSARVRNPDYSAPPEPRRDPQVETRPQAQPETQRNTAIEDETARATTEALRNWATQRGGRSEVRVAPAARDQRERDRDGERNRRGRDDRNSRMAPQAQPQQQLQIAPATERREDAQIRERAAARGARRSDQDERRERPDDQSAAGSASGGDNPGSN